jgi:hypothetical protein
VNLAIDVRTNPLRAVPFFFCGHDYVQLLDYESQVNYCLLFFDKLSGFIPMAMDTLMTC